VWLAIVAVIIFGLGLGMGMPVFTLTVQNAVSPAQLGVVTASAQLFRNLGGTIGIAVMGTVMNASLVKNMNVSSRAHGFDFSKLDPQLAEQVAEFQNPEMLLDHPKLEQLRATLPADIQPIITQMIETLQDALSASLTTVF